MRSGTLDFSLSPTMESGSSLCHRPAAFWNKGMFTSSGSRLKGPPTLRSVHSGPSRVTVPRPCWMAMLSHTTRSPRPPIVFQNVRRFVLVAEELGQQGHVLLRGESEDLDGGLL